VFLFCFVFVFLKSKNPSPPPPHTHTQVDFYSKTLGITAAEVGKMAKKIMGKKYSNNNNKK